MLGLICNEPVFASSDKAMGHGARLMGYAAPHVAAEARLTTAAGFFCQCFRSDRLCQPWPATAAVLATT